MIIDNKLKEFATARQLEYIDAVNKTGSIFQTAKLLKVTRSSIQCSLALLRKSAAKRGYAPDHDMTRIAPDPFIVKGVSSYYNRDGDLSGQWVKTTLDQDKLQQAIAEAIEALTQDAPRVTPTKAPKNTLSHLCNNYTLTDTHIGARCWKPETGGDWDLSIAENMLCEGFYALIHSSPSAETGIITVLGDFLHFDSLQAVTPQHGHILDGDGRYSKVISVAVRILRSIISTALDKHKKIIVVIMEGNHDQASSVWLRHLFALLFENEKRVTVHNFELPYFAMQHGQVMLGFHHGHIRKNEALPLLFAAQFPDIWGITKKRYVHTGHRHHKHELEYSGITIIQHPTLAARDAYAARGGWISDRSITSITYHSEHGEVARNTITPEMIV